MDMTTFVGIFYVVVAAYLFILPFAVNATGAYFWLFKIMPFFLGLASAFLALQHYGFVVRFATS